MAVPNLPPTCGGCGKVVAGSYTTALNRLWHPEHFVCTICKRPIRSGFQMAGDQPAHATCWLEHVAPRCKICGQPIGEAYTTDIWGETSCLSCYDACRCDHCGGAGHAIAFSRQRRCPTCRRLAVVDAMRAGRLYDEVATWLARKRFFEHFPCPGVELYAQERLRHQTGSADNALGLARTLSLHGPQGTLIKADQVIIQSGLPEPVFQMVAAHELGHVWVAGSQILHLTKREEEGLCQLLSYMWLLERGGRGREGLMKGIQMNVDPIYGEGFRIIKAQVEASGLDVVLSSMMTARTSKRRLL